MNDNIWLGFYFVPYGKTEVRRIVADNYKEAVIKFENHLVANCIFNGEMIIYKESDIGLVW